VVTPAAIGAATAAALTALESATTAALAGKSDTGHTHPQYEATANKGQANGYASLDGSGKVPAAQLPASGSDPWTYLKITSADFTTTSNVAQDITGLGFTPQANTWYEFHGMLLLRTATATVNPRAGLAWASGLTDGVGRVEQAQAAGTAPLNANGNINASLLIAVGGLPNTTQSWPATVWGTFRSGASPSGNVRLQLASETNGTTVRATIGSYLRYRIIP
jgi:hypothetical protein